MSKAKERGNDELAKELSQKRVNRRSSELLNRWLERVDATKLNCLKDSRGRLILDESGKKRVWKEYMEKLLNEESEWDGEVEAGRREGPECEI